MTTQPPVPPARPRTSTPAVAAPPGSMREAADRVSRAIEAAFLSSRGTT